MSMTSLTSGTSRLERRAAALFMEFLQSKLCQTRSQFAFCRVFLYITRFHPVIQGFFPAFPAIFCWIDRSSRTMDRPESGNPGYLEMLHRASRKILGCYVEWCVFRAGL